LFFFNLLPKTQQRNVLDFHLLAPGLAGSPLGHARYLQATKPLYTNTDIWADSLLNKSAHAAETCKQPTPNLPKNLPDWPTSVEFLPNATSLVFHIGTTVKTTNHENEQT
jgi:hypothetical protein